MSEAYVLYVDYQGHPAPLSVCYATAVTRRDESSGQLASTLAQRLSSSVDRFPPCTTTEVDSAYCPQCLSFHDASSAATLVYCPKPLCRCCPCGCSVPLTVLTKNGTAFYGSSSCTWTSEQCGLVVPIASPESKVDLARALEDLGIQLTERKRELQLSTERYYQQVLERWTQRPKPTTFSSSGLFSRRTSANPNEGVWSLEVLEQTLQQKKEHQSSFLLATSNAELLGGIQQFSLNDLQDEEIQQDATISPLAMQSQAMNTMAESLLLLPLPIPLRARTSRRCRAELAEGKAGILVKPKLNPVEGDSSLRSGHGQWFKKDSSAALVLPRVRVMQHARVRPASSTHTYRVFLLQVTNPTLGNIRLRFCASDYEGEVCWDTENEASQDSSSRTAQMDHLLVDTFLPKYIHAELDRSVMQGLVPTETVELQSAEDSFIELGSSKSRSVPDAVRHWSPLQATKPLHEPNLSLMRLLAHSAYTAWFELVVVDTKAEERRINAGDHRSPSVPVALQIQMGTDTWQLSGASSEEATPPSDWTTFDLVIAWQ
jgi:dynactin 4